MSFARYQNQKFQVEGVEINPKSRTCVRLQDNRRFSLTPQQLEILLLLLENTGKVVTYEKFEENIWEGVSVETRPILRHAVTHLRQIFGKEKIETVTDTGYRFVETEIVLAESGNDTSEQNQTPEINSQPEFSDQKIDAEVDAISIGEEADDEILPAFDLSRSFGGHVYFVAAACLLYSSVCVVSLYLETAYEFQEHKSNVFKSSILIFVLAMSFSLLSFRSIHFLNTKKYSAKGLAAGIFVIVIGSLITVLVGDLILPAYPVTKISNLENHTHTAQASHFKNVFVYLQLFYLPAITIPYALIISWKNKINSGEGEDIRKILRGNPSRIALPSRLNFSPFWMFIILLAVFTFSVFTTHLFLDKLEPNENQDFFSKLLWARNILYHCIGIMGVWWYYENRKEVEAFCRAG